MGDISERLLFLVKRHTKGKVTVFAKKAGIPPSTFQYYINDRMPHGEHLKRICETFNVNLNWLLIGKGDPYISSEANEKTGDKGAEVFSECLPNHSEISDAEIVEQFNDKKYARVLNLHLVELERLNSEAFKKVDPYIQGMLDGLRMKPTHCCMYKGPDRRNAERRGKDNPEKFKGAKDRRSGKDRRIAVNG
jgi:transcriptional regulator with XRE-family HTH domain